MYLANGFDSFFGDAGIVSSMFQQHVLDVAGVDEFAPARSLDVQGVFVADSCSWTTCLLFPCV